MSVVVATASPRWRTVSLRASDEPTRVIAVALGRLGCLPLLPARGLVSEISRMNLPRVQSIRSLLDLPVRGGGWLQWSALPDACLMKALAVNTG
jgi:hypothetical protein